jgi:membrane dipeptidase
MSAHDLTRREFAKSALATASSVAMAGMSPTLLASAVSPSRAPVAERENSAWPGYDRAMVVDALGWVTPFGASETYTAPIDARMLEDVRASGVTAVNATCSASGDGARAFIGTVSNIAYWEREFTAHPEVFLKVKRAADLEEAKRTRRLGVILGTQDATMLSDDVTRVDLFYNLGVRILQLTYNIRNLLGDGCLETANGGLSALGRKMVARMNEVGMLVDVGHVGYQTSFDAVKASTKPIACTHTGCLALNDVPRNKPDALLKAISDSGGVVGIYLMPFLRSNAAPTTEDVIRHLSHAVNVCGENHVGIGSDVRVTPIELTPEFKATHLAFVRGRRAAGTMAPGESEDVYNYVPELNSVRRMELIADSLAKAGHSSSRIEKILGSNWLRLFREVWK